jgi:hypothetical protein
MGQQRGSRHNREIGSFAGRMLWIPVIGAVLVTGFLAVHPLKDENVAAMAVSSAKAFATVGPDEVAFAAGARTAEVAPAPTEDAAVKEHEALDPVAAGHDVAR